MRTARESRSTKLVLWRRLEDVERKDKGSQRCWEPTTMLGNGDD